MDLKELFQRYLNFVKTYIPEPRVHSSVGIDIGLSTCKMVEVKPSAGSFELVQWGVAPIIGGDPSSAVQALLSKVPGQHHKPATAVQGKGTLIRYIEFPRMSQEELVKSFAYEADKYLPFTNDQIYSDCMILDPKGKTNKMTVLVAAARREIIDERIGFLKNIGIEPDLITLNSIALGNVMNALGVDTRGRESSGKGDGASVIVDMGAKVTNVNVMYDGLPRFTRDIFVGGLDLTTQIAQGLGISLEEAERMKCAPGMRQPEVLAACEPVVLNLISDMRLSLDYFMTENNIPVSKIFLSGGTALLEGITEIFTKTLEIEVSRWDPFSYVTIPGPLKKEAEKISGQFGVALGLALY